MTITPQIILSAKDETKAAFDSINAALTKMSGTGINLQDSFKGAALALTGLAGVGSLAVLKGKVDDAINSMGGLKDASEATGASVEKLSGLKAVAKLGDRDFEAIQGAIVKLNKALHGTDDESKGAGKALAAMGLDLQALRQMDPADAFVKIAQAQEKFADGGGKSAALLAIMGKNAATMIPYLHDLADQQAIVGKLTAQQAKDADDYEKNVRRLQASWGNLSRQLAAAAVGPLKDITDWMVKAKQEGGTLESLFMGIGAAVVKAFGGEINPMKILEEDANKAFSKVMDLRKKVAATQSDMDAGKFGILGKAFGQSRLESLQKDLADAEKVLDRVTRKKSALAAKEVAADQPKDTSLNAQTFGKEGTPKGRAEADPAATLIASLDKKLAVMALDMQATGKLTEAEKELAAVQQQLDSGTLKATARQRELIIGKQEALVAYEKVIKAMEVEAGAADRAQQQLGAFFDSLDEQARSLEKQADLYGLTAAQIAVVTQARLEDAIAQAKEQGAGEDQIAILERELDARKRITDAQIIMAEKQQQIDEQAKKTNDTLEEFSKQAARNIQDAMADFLFDPFAKGTQGMLQSFGTMIQKMISQAVAADLAKRLFGDLVQGGKGDGLLGAGLGWLGGLFKNADGGVYSGAGISAYSGAIVSHPTVFPFARGIGLMGEAGPEAILPLKRGGDGKLGVAAGGGQAINIHINMGADGDPAKVRRAAAAGAREALAVINGAHRYG